MLIGPGDRFRLADGVEPAGDALLDPVRVEVIELDGCGPLVVRLADGRTIADAAAAVADVHAIEPERALSDTLGFCGRLNALFLANVEPAGGRAVLALRWLRAAARGAPFGLFPGLPPARRAVDTTTRRRAAASVLPALAPLATVASLLATLPALAVVDPAAALPLGAAVGLGLLVHEVGHAAALPAVPACLVVAGASVRLLHRPLGPGPRAVVAVAGPAAAGLAAAVALGAAWLFSTWEAALAAGPLAGQALALTVLAADGRAACDLS